MRLTDEGGHIRHMNGDETLARMLGSCRHRSASEDFFALCTEQAAACNRAGVAGSHRDVADATVRFSATHPNSNHGKFRKVANRLGPSGRF